MFATYDSSRFPIVLVTFTNNITNENFNNFIISWKNLYDDQKDFSFIFDTRAMGNIPIKYAIKMAYFIKILKKYEYQYLQKSLILVNSDFIKYLLDLVFAIEKPVAPVYIWRTSDTNYYNIVSLDYQRYREYGIIEVLP
tara:strand:+ start:369 stop:785 length:417 start_codon:yes stop_codon:yes gene_type:complete